MAPCYYFTIILRMKQKMLNPVGKLILGLFLCLAGLLLSERMQAQTLTQFSGITVQGTWYESAHAVSLLTQEIDFLETSLYAPPSTRAMYIMKYKHWLYEQILQSIQAGESVESAVAVNHSKVSGFIAPDNPSAHLNNQDVAGLLTAAVDLLTY